MDSKRGDAYTSESNSTLSNAAHSNASLPIASESNSPLSNAAQFVASHSYTSHSNTSQSNSAFSSTSRFRIR